MIRTPSVLAPCLLLAAGSHALLAQQLVAPAALAAPGAAAQHAPATPDAEHGPWRSRWISIDRAAFGLQWIDGALIAEGAGYHVTFDRGSFRFLPALGRAAPADRPVTFAVETIGRRATVLYEANGADVSKQPALAADGKLASWNRGGILERFEARADGIEHSFVFAERPAGTGDLVVRLRVETDLVADAGRDLRQLELFEPGIGKVTIGAVTGIDARGARSPGSMHFDGRHLELVLPARFVDAAAYPMVLDPLINSAVLTAHPDDSDRAPDCTYDASTDRYLIVWERFFSSTNIAVRGQMVQGNGTFAGSFLVITDQGGPLETNPKIANIAVNDCFVVAWVQGASTTGQKDIACRLVRADQGTFGPILLVATGTNDQVDPDIGGEATHANNDVMVVFRDATAGNIQLRQIDFDRASGQGTLGRQLLIAGPDPAIGRPAISKSGGTGRKYLVAWDAGGIYIGNRIVDHDATAWTGVGLVSGREPEKVDVDGDGERWTMVWNELEPGQSAGGNRDVWAITILAPAAPSTGTPLFFTNSKRAVAANPNDDEAEPAVAYYGDATTSTSTVAWYDATARPASVLAGTNIQRTSNVRSGNPFTTGPTSGFQVRWPSFATRLSGGVTSYDGMLTFWANNLATLNGDVYVQLHRVHEGGPVASVGPGCGGGGQVSLDFALALGRRTNIRLQQADPSAILGFLLVGNPGSPRTTCGPCTMMTNTPVVTVGVNSGTAAFSLFVPGDPSYTGMNLDLQFAVIGPAIQSCVLVPGAAVSNIVRATILD